MFEQLKKMIDVVHTQVYFRFGMIRIVVALLTFAIGSSAVYLVKQAWSINFEDVPAVYVPVPAHAAEIDDSEPRFVPFFDSLDNDSYFSGWFMADKFKGMDEVWTLLLSRDDSSEKVKYYAMVLTSNPDGSSNDADSFIASTLTTKQDRLAFKTVKIRGIQYKFDGRFLYGGSGLRRMRKCFAAQCRK